MGSVNEETQGEFHQPIVRSFSCRFFYDGQIKGKVEDKDKNKFEDEIRDKICIGEHGQVESQLMRVVTLQLLYLLFILLFISYLILIIFVQAFYPTQNFLYILLNTKKLIFYC